MDNINRNLKHSALFIIGALFAFLAIARESTVITSKGTFRCENACVVDENGNVTDNAGGKVWKLVVPEAPKDT
ncbi:hypothetical protein [Thalassotalea agarivorans]|uniref:Uncharacterized protein n=1 Tax=Thalassotalea agarivorans TaxID=349064 RepID=A0A1I0CEC5_THASX|nr:hypothetical protein [Thalassotalea agarivorans]SET17937.1 hypothetical protein SAMN05660429_01172 [Thalassotalea agarivorans]